MRFILGHHMRVAEYKANLYTVERNAKISAAHADGRIPTVEHLSGSAHPSWRGDDVGYARAHERVVTQRGPASDYACRECGGTAHEWALNHAYCTLKMDVHGGREKAMSTDVNAYVPLCRVCHRTADRRGGYRAD